MSTGELALASSVSDIRRSESKAKRSQSPETCIASLSKVCKGTTEKADSKRTLTNWTGLRRSFWDKKEITENPNGQNTEGATKEKDKGGNLDRFLIANVSRWLHLWAQGEPQGASEESEESEQWQSEISSPKNTEHC
jgi:hypothetical protein